MELVYTRHLKCRAARHVGSSPTRTTVQISDIGCRTSDSKSEIRHLISDIRTSGYRIVAIILPCQGRDTGSIPVTRSESTYDN